MTSPKLSMSQLAVARYNITAEQFQLMKDKQHGACALVGLGCAGRLCIDHRDDIVRGFLCEKHNRLLGHYEDLLPIIDQLEDYLAGKKSLFTPMIGLRVKRCEMEGCTAIVAAKKLCMKHYRRVLRLDRANGEPG